jgi:hypothetical protein
MLHDLFNTLVFPYRYHMATRPLAPRKAYIGLIEETYGLSSPEFHKMSGDDLKSVFAGQNEETKQAALGLYVTTAATICISVAVPPFTALFAGLASFIFFATALQMKSTKRSAYSSFEDWQLQERIKEHKKDQPKEKRKAANNKKFAKAPGFA